MKKNDQIEKNDDAITYRAYRGVFGTNNTNKYQVTVNSFTPWYMENVDIDF